MIAFNIIATNRYIEFAQRLIVSLNKHCKLEFKINLFTNNSDVSLDAPNSVIKIEHEPWPAMTLNRYHFMSADLSIYEGCSHIFYLDADMLIVDDFGEEILGERMATIHPGFFNKPRHMFTYETNPVSKAYISPVEGTKYYCGGFNGGSVKEFIKMSETIKRNVDCDKRYHNHVALWHDESHFNRYMIDNPPTLVMDPSYCYPESWQLPFKKIILALDKNHAEYQK
jgi:histo-blood group ABO system transferase